MTLYKKRYRIESSRLAGWDYSSPAWYFVTICTHEKRSFLGEMQNDKVHLSRAGEIVVEEWQKTAAIRANVTLDEFVVMPNHIHGIVVIKEPNMAASPRVETPRRGVSTAHRPQKASLSSIIGQFKSVSTKRIWAAGHREFGWQSRYHDRIIRSDRALAAIREYIANNPSKWALHKENPANLG